MKDEDPFNPSPGRLRMDTAHPEDSFYDEGLAELHQLLSRWDAPQAPVSLERNLLDAFRARKHELLINEISPSLPVQSPLLSEKETNMRQCQICQEEFADKFSFCPVDGTPLDKSLDAEPAFVVSQETASANSAGVGGFYNLTIIEDAGLVHRLVAELREAARQSQLTFPEFKRDPIGFSRRSMTAFGAMTWRFISAPNVAIATLAAILFMMSAVIGLVWVDRHRAESIAKADRERADLELVEMVDIPDNSEAKKEGAAGMDKGDGGGSLPEKRKAGGGGGGGRSEQTEASNGKLPQATFLPQVLAPDPKPPNIKNPSLPTAATIQADPLLFPTDPRQIPYGDPKSDATALSSGTGTGNGIGSGSGGGVGSGSGRGYGPGSDYNTGGGPGTPGGGGRGGGGDNLDPNRVFKPNEVTTKARILSKPTPEYTEDARKNQVTGTVVLQMVLSSSGAVTNIRTVTGLPFGLTEKAIAAARRIQFSPATKEGRAVSQYVRVEYNFNIY